MDVGAAIALSSGVLGVVAIIFRIFPKRAEPRDCPMHSGMEAQIRAMNAWLRRVEDKLDRVIERRQHERAEG
jgi:hypothetical protein